MYLFSFGVSWLNIFLTELITSMQPRFPLKQYGCSDFPAFLDPVRQTQSPLCETYLQVLLTLMKAAHFAFPVSLPCEAYWTGKSPAKDLTWEISSSCTVTLEIIARDRQSLQVAILEEQRAAMLKCHQRASAHLLECQTALTESEEEEKFFRAELDRLTSEISKKRKRQDTKSQDQEVGEVIVNASQSHEDSE